MWHGEARSYTPNLRERVARTYRPQSLAPGWVTTRDFQQPTLSHIHKHVLRPYKQKYSKITTTVPLHTQ